MSLSELRDFYGLLKQDYHVRQQKIRERRQHVASHEGGVAQAEDTAIDETSFDHQVEPLSQAEGMFYQPLASDMKIPPFRLLQLYPGRGDEAIVCRSSHYKLSGNEHPEYEALSYCWGSETPTDTIIFNGSRFPVRRNLFEALRCLRPLRTARVLWIDAICINQTDFSERSQQVQLIREIYEHAIRVLIWIGPPDTAGTEAIEALCKCAEKAQAQFRDASIEAPDRRVVNHPPAVYDNVKTLLLRDWFSRIWTVQEVTVAREAVVVWDDKLIDWDVLSVGISEGFRTAMFRTDFLGTSVETAFHRHAALVAARERRDGKASAADRFHHLLVSFRNRKATDPKDKVFALLGLVEARFDLDGVASDYGIALEDLYIRTAAIILQQSSDLRLLSTCLSNTSGETSEFGRRLPSWVPDWSNPSFIAWPFEAKGFGFSNIPSVTHNDSTFCSFGVNGQLRLEGYGKDVIIAVAEPLDVSPRATLLEAENDTENTTSPDKLDLNTRKRSKALLRTAQWGFGKLMTGWDDLVTAGDYLRVLVRWEKFAGIREDRARTPAAQSPLKCAYMETLLAGQLPEGAHEMFDKWFASLNPVRQTEILNKQVATVVGMPSYFKATWGGFPEFHEHLGYAQCRRLARTQQGHLALVPSHTEIGDVIGLFKGSRWPLVKRIRSDGDWTFIGQAYVHGIVYEKAFESHRCQPIFVR